MSVQETKLASGLEGAANVVTGPHGTWTGLEIRRSLGPAPVRQDDAGWSDPERLAAELPPGLLGALRAGSSARRDQLAEVLSRWLPATPTGWRVPHEASSRALVLVAACALAGLTGEGIRFGGCNETQLLSEQGDYSLEVSPATTKPGWPEGPVPDFTQDVADLVAASTWLAVDGVAGEAIPIPAAGGREHWSRVEHPGDGDVAAATVLDAAMLECAVEEAGLPRDSIYGPLHASGATSFDAMILAEVLTVALKRQITMKDLILAERIADLARIPATDGPPRSLRLTPEQGIFASLEALEPGTEKYRAIYAFELPPSVERGRLQEALGKVHESQDVLHRSLQVNEGGEWRVGYATSFSEVFSVRGVEGQSDVSRAANDARSQVDFVRGGAPYRLEECDHGDGSTTLVVCAHHIAFDEESLSFWLEEVGKCYDNTSYSPPRTSMYTRDAHPPSDTVPAEASSEAAVDELVVLLRRECPPASWNLFDFEHETNARAVGSLTKERRIDTESLVEVGRTSGCLPLDFVVAAFLYALSAFHQEGRPVVGMPVSLRSRTDEEKSTGPQVAIAPVWGVTGTGLAEAESPESVGAQRSAMLVRRALLRPALGRLGKEVHRSASGSLFTGFVADVNEAAALHMGGVSYGASRLLPIPPKFPCTLFVDRTRPEDWVVQLECDGAIIGMRSLEKLCSRFDEYLLQHGLRAGGNWSPAGAPPGTGQGERQEYQPQSVDEGHGVVTGEAVRKPLGAALRDVFERDFDLDEGFIAQGGDSLGAVRVANALRRQGYSLKPIELLRKDVLKDIELLGGSEVRSCAADDPSDLGAEASVPSADTFSVSRMQEGLIYESLDNPDAYRFTYVAELVDSTDVAAMRLAVEQTVAEMPQLTAVPEYDRGKALRLRSVDTWRVSRDPRGGNRGAWVDSPHFRIEYTSRNGSARHSLVLDFDHFVLDGESASIFYRRVAERYAALTNGSPVAQRDFDPTALVEFQRATLDSSEFAGRRTAAGCGARPVAPLRYVTSRSSALTIPTGDLQDIERTRSSLGITASALGVWLAANCLAKMGGLEEVGVGLISDGRDSPVDNASEAVGCVMRNLPFSVRAGEDGAREVQEKMRDAQDRETDNASIAAADLIVSFNQRPSVDGEMGVFSGIETSGRMSVGASVSFVWEVGLGEISYDPLLTSRKEPEQAWAETLEQLKASLRENDAGRSTALGRAVDGQARSQVDAVHSTIQLCWREVLGPDRDQELFLDAGGDSIAAVRLCIGLRNSGYRVRPKDVFANPSVGMLAEFLVRQLTNEAQNA